MELKEIQSGLSPEVAKVTLTQWPEIPAAIRNVFGSPNIKELIDILMDPGIVDVDMLFLTGQLNRDEFLQYLKRLPENLAAKEQISGIVQKMAGEIKAKIPQLVAATLRCDKKNDLTHIIIKLAKIKEILIVKKHGSLRNMLVQDFYEKAMVMFYALLNDHFQGHDRQARDRFLGAFGNMMNEISKAGSTGFSCTDFIQEREFYRDAMADPLYFGRMNELTGALVRSEEERKEFKEELDLEFKEIEEAAQMKKICFTVYDYGSAGKIVLMGDDLVNEREFYTQLCGVHVFLRPDEQPLPPDVRDGKIEFTISNGEIAFHVNRGSGELSFMTNQGTSLSTIMNPDQYLYLRSTVYMCLRQYLASKEEDIDDLFSKADVPPKSISAEVQRDVEEAVISIPLKVETERAETADQAGIGKYVPYEKNEQVRKVEDVAPDRVSDKTCREKRSEYLRRLKNVSGLKILAAVKNLLGGPSVRVQGSHHIILSNRTGKTYPIPVHGSRPVKFGIILDCLEMWGIGLEELCEKI
jgi:predicted RNA binding protein YcfA (HicA-like mRNA interferase family)